MWGAGVYGYLHYPRVAVQVVWYTHYLGAAQHFYL